MEGDEGEQQQQPQLSGLSFKSIYPLSICHTGGKSSNQSHYKSPERRSPKKYDKRSLNEDNFGAERKMKKLAGGGGYKKVAMMARAVSHKTAEVGDEVQTLDKDIGDMVSPTQEDKEPSKETTAELDVASEKADCSAHVRPPSTHSDLSASDSPLNPAVLSS